MPREAKPVAGRSQREPTGLGATCVHDKVWLALGMVSISIPILAGSVWLLGARSLAASLAVTLIYAAWFAASLSHGWRLRDLSRLGLTRRRLVWSVLGGLLVGTFGFTGLVSNTPGYEGGHLVLQPWDAVAAVLATGFLAGMVESIAIYGYLQFELQRRWGRLASVLATAAVVALFHLALAFEPGAGTYGMAMGLWQFAAGIFLGGLLVATVVALTQNVWGAVVQNGLMGNVLANLYVLSVRPEEVIIADPTRLWLAAPLLVLALVALVVVAVRVSRDRAKQALP